MQKIMMYIAYTAGALFIVFGLAILFTDLLPTYLPSQFKIMMGIVLVLYGAYRIISIVFKKRQDEKPE
jgi:hypothetical protein